MLISSWVQIEYLDSVIIERKSSRDLEMKMMMMMMMMVLMMMIIIIIMAVMMMMMLKDNKRGWVGKLAEPPMALSDSSFNWNHKLVSIVCSVAILIP